MKKLLAFVIFYSFLWILGTFAIFLCPATKAQWEGAQVQRLTYNVLPNEMLKLYIDDNDKLYLFYLEGVRDTITGFVYDYRILYKTSEKGSAWSQPEEIQTSTYIFGQNHKAGLWMDTRTKIIHLAYTNYLWTNLYYTNSTIPNWESVKIDSLSEQNAQCENFAMGFDTMGNVHIAWHVDFDSIGAEWFRVMYANNSTGEWVKQQVSPPIFLGGMGSGETIFDVQKNGIAHIVYYGGSWGLAYYARNDSLNGNYWHIDTIPKPQRPLYYYGARLIKVDSNDRIRLITGGCIAEDCVWPGKTRTFYYSKQFEDSLWQGPEQLPDTTFGSFAGMIQLLVDQAEVPYASYGVNPGRVYFTDRKQGFWLQLYQILDQTYYASGFSFVLDSDGGGHGAFAGYLREFMAQDDSLEISYYGPPLNSVEDTLEEQRKFNFELFQNYPNPFNPVTSIRYTVVSRQTPIHTTLIVYNILGQLVRTLVDEEKAPGNYSIVWNGKDDSGKEVSSGIYFYQLTAGDYQETRKLVLIK